MSTLTIPDKGFIGIHLGVGKYNEKDLTQIQNLITKACDEAIKLLKMKKSAALACCAAIKVLENDKFCNAGYGSNLSRSGAVECEAAIMDGKTYNFGACGALRKIKNPIQLATILCNNQSKKSKYGLIQPEILVGEGAHEYAEIVGLQIINNEDLMTKNALKTYSHQKKILENAKDKTDKFNQVIKVKLDRGIKRSFELEHDDKPIKVAKPNEYLNDNKETLVTDSSDIRLDTVGAVCLDSFGNVAAACSSGGIALKFDGRLGHTCVIGAGIWADDDIAVCTTGCGEYLTKTLLAKEIAKNYDGNVKLKEILKKCFLENKMLKNFRDNKIAGALVLSVDKNSSKFSFEFAHTSLDLIVGYRNINEENAICVLDEEKNDTNLTKLIY